MKLRASLENDLRALADVKVELWKDSDLMCVFYRGKEFAHFHDQEEIDIRLTQAFIKRKQLKPLEDSIYHLKRSEKSQWMQFRFKTKAETKELLDLIQRLIKEEYEGTAWGKDS